MSRFSKLLLPALLLAVGAGTLWAAALTGRTGAVPSAVEPPGGAAVTEAVLDLVGLSAVAEPLDTPDFEAVFELENRGTHPAEIVGVVSGCKVGGCLGRRVDGRLPIPPGESVTLKLTGKRWRPGPFQDSTVLYVTHGTTTHSVEVTVRGDLPDGDGFMSAEEAATRTKLVDRNDR